MSGRRRPMKLEAAQSLWRLPSLGAGAGETVITGQDVTSVVFAETIGQYNPTVVKLTDTFTKLTNPATLPVGDGYGAAFDPTSTYLAVAHWTTPFVTIYKRSGDTFTKLTNPGTLPTGIGLGAAFDPTSTYLAIAHWTASPFVTIYKRSGDTFTKLTNPATLPTGIGQGAAFDPTSTYLAIAHSTTPFVTIYKMDQKAYLGGNHILNVTGAPGVTAAGYAKEAGAATETKQVVRIWRTGP